MTALGDHAIAELDRIGAPDVIRDPVILIVGTFADVPDPHTNWPIMRDYLEKLLHFAPLTSITNDPVVASLRTVVDKAAGIVAAPWRRPVNRPGTR